MLAPSLIIARSWDNTMNHQLTLDKPGLGSNKQKIFNPLEPIPLTEDKLHSMEPSSTWDSS